MGSIDSELYGRECRAAYKSKLLSLRPGKRGGWTGLFFERGKIMRILVQRKIFYVFEISLLFLLFLSVFLIGTALAVDKPKGTLGLFLGEITPQIKQAAGLREVNGALIQQVLRDSAAARVGLQAGDLVIGVDNSGVIGLIDVVQRIGKHSSGESIALVILRPDGQGHVQQFRVNPVLQPVATGFIPGQPVPQPSQAFSSPQSNPLANPPANPLGSQFKQKPLSTPSPLGTGFAGSMVPVRTLVSQYGNCSAVAPANWIIYGSRREGDALDIIAPDRSMTANYLILGIAGIATQINPNLYATPEIYLRHYISFGGKLPVSYGQPIRDDFGYTWLPYETDPNNPRGGAMGVVFYRVWPIAGNPPGYILLFRQAQTMKQIWKSQGAQAIAVALSIRCTVQLRPSGGTGGRDRTDDDKVESSYNQQLGMEYAHDAATGENYWVSPSTDWQNDGPEGPGYYKRSGNDLRKLSPGRK
jgi:hypothetical protein